MRISRRELIKCYRLARQIGFDPRKLLSLARLGRFAREWREYQRANTIPSMLIRFRSLYPILIDYDVEAGRASGDYFHQDLWAARKIFAARPPRHVDVGSRIDGFVAHLLVFMPVEVVDTRRLKSNVAGLRFVQADATSLSLYADNSVVSLSTLNAVEHFGLGRYSDPIDPLACFKFMNALQRVLAPDGRLYFSTLVGQARLEFNAHRVFDLQMVLDSLSALRLLSLSYIDEAGDLHENVRPADFPSANCTCTLFEFTKTAPA